MLVFAFRPPIRVPNFSEIEARTHELWRFVRNDEEKEKNEEILQNFADSYLGNGLKDLVKFEMWPPLHGG